MANALIQIKGRRKKPLRARRQYDTMVPAHCLDDGFSTE